jgi:hypothetical protein
MPISSPAISPRDVVIIQRSDDGSYYGETHISGSNRILYIDSSGHINADDSASFYSLFPVSASSGGGGGGGTTLFTGSTYQITSSWAINTVNGVGSGTTLFTGSTYEITASQAISASWAPGISGGGTTLFTGSTYPITSSWSQTSSYAVNENATFLFTGSTYQITASSAISASFASQSLSSSYSPGGATYTSSLWGTASWANNSLTASYITSSNIVGTVASTLMPYIPTYGTTSSFNPSSSISQGQLIFWINPVSTSYMDTYGQYPATFNGNLIRHLNDLSGLNRNVSVPIGAAGYNKFMYLTGVGHNNNKCAVWVENFNGVTCAAVATTPTYPLWLFAVLKIPSGSTSAGIFDGNGASNRFFCSAGTSPQIYSGTSLSAAITGSLTGSIQNKWFLQSFKNTAGGLLSYIKTNGTQSITAGSCGTQTINGYNFGGDDGGNGGGIAIAEMFLYSNITDADAVNIETYLMAKHELSY